MLGHLHNSPNLTSHLFGFPVPAPFFFFFFKRTVIGSLISTGCWIKANDIQVKLHFQKHTGSSLLCSYFQWLGRVGLGRTELPPAQAALGDTSHLCSTTLSKGKWLPKWSNELQSEGTSDASCSFWHQSSDCHPLPGWGQQWHRGHHCSTLQRKTASSQLKGLVANLSNLAHTSKEPFVWGSGLQITHGFTQTEIIQHSRQLPRAILRVLGMTWTCICQGPL